MRIRAQRPGNWQSLRYFAAAARRSFSKPNGSVHRVCDKLRLSVPELSPMAIDGIPLNIHFKCTQCAYCCHHSKIPLTVEEAIEWLRDRHQVQVICEASPWVPPEARKADYLLRRSFPARSGTLFLRIAVTLVANLADECPNLLPDRRCGIYERRPLVSSVSRFLGGMVCCRTLE